jgi:hypothetical protein
LALFKPLHHPESLHQLKRRWNPGLTPFLFLVIPTRKDGTKEKKSEYQKSPNFSDLALDFIPSAFSLEL